MLKSKLLSATAAAPEPVFIEDVFSTWLYTGTGSTRTITNGIDLAGEGGLVWTKTRSDVRSHYLTDTEIGPNNVLSTNSSDPTNNFGSIGFTSFNSDGFTVGSSSVANSTSDTIASWTFRKAPRFFDVVTFSTTTGSSTPITVNHNLGATPGCIIVKQTNATADWFVYHRSASANYYLSLNSTASQQNGGTSKFYPAPDNTSFYLGGDFVQNGTYVAYLFAHDPLGPSGDGSDGLIACGSYVGNTTTYPEINLGWEPQWVLIKRTDQGNNYANWCLMDNMRNLNHSFYNNILAANLSEAEGGGFLAGSYQVKANPNGFTVQANEQNVNATGSTYIYIAIRRGPMRQPTSGTEVFDAQTYTASTGTVRSRSFAADMLLGKSRTLGDSGVITDRLRGFLTSNANTSPSLFPSLTNAEVNQSPDEYNVNNDSFTDGSYYSGYSLIKYAFRRAPGFFDAVAYSGNDTAGRTVSHNLGVTPEMMIVKRRSNADGWFVYHAALGATKTIILNDYQPASTSITIWNNTAPSASVFTLGSNSGLNGSGSTYIAYLFATLPGISKVGSYTGNGSSQTINCGFTSGARFIIIKRTDGSGAGIDAWYVWDTARGIVAGNDPHLSLNSTAAEVTSDDSIDPDSSGFIVNQVAATNINVSSASYIYLAIA